LAAYNLEHHALSYESRPKENVNRREKSKKSRSGRQQKLLSFYGDEWETSVLFFFFLKFFRRLKQGTGLHGSWLI
jgi:hypothetical protein